MRTERAEQRPGFLIVACLAKVSGVFKGSVAQMVGSFLHWCHQDVGRKDKESRGGIDIVRQCEKGPGG